MEERKKQSILFHPIISSIQKIALYETKCHFYLMGSNNTLTRFRVLKIDRNEPRELVFLDDKIEYSQEEIKDLVKMIDMGNRNRGNVSGVTKVVSAFGIIGFICFLEGYYIILITKRRKIAVIGHHTIYKIEDTSMIYIPNNTVRLFHPDEQRYVKMFQSIDLSSNFYFSYSYDLTHTLQSNMTPPKHIEIKISACNSNSNNSEDSLKIWKYNNCNNNGNNTKIINYGIQSNPHRRYIWNCHLLSLIEKNVHTDWILHIIHGFVGQSNVSIFGRSMYITIIARRSVKYAGTRFLKRGANFEGDVANEVETEQIVHDSSVSSLKNGCFSSFVQMRGSVPGHWSQDISKMVPKPTIIIDLSDPFVETAGAHFNELFKRYGSPIIILNLVKKRERKKHESILSDEMIMAVKYLNQFLPIEHSIQYISFDMARKNKGKKANVMEQLANIANNAVLKTGIFHSLYSYCNGNHTFTTKKLHNDVFDSINETVEFNDANNYNLINDKIKQYFTKKGFVQTGIIRTNCVDCLDRTNTAQFSIGKCALGYQLYTLGILNTPKLEFDTDCVRMLEELYEDHGDTLALQYGGSQLVHRIKTYRKTAPWTSQGNDIMQTLSRYYSNTFSDQEKQHTINLFLGLYIPEDSRPPIWELLTDYYLHHKPASRYVPKSKILTQWWDRNVLKCLPYSLLEITKTGTEIIRVQDYQEELIDIYYDYYRPFELTLLTEVYTYQISHSVRDFMPHFTTNFSPFVVRVRPGRRREETTNKNTSMKNPSLTGHSSTSSAASSASSSLTSSSNDEENEYINDLNITSLKTKAETSFKTLFPSMKKVYGIQPEYPKRMDSLIYKKYVLIEKNSIYKIDRSLYYKLFNQTLVSKDFKIVKQSVIDTKTSNIYMDYIKRAKYGPLMPKSSDMNLYERCACQE